MGVVSDSVMALRFHLGLWLAGLLGLGSLSMFWWWVFGGMCSCLYSGGHWASTVASV